MDVFVTYVTIDMTDTVKRNLAAANRASYVRFVSGTMRIILFG